MELHQRIKEIREKKGISQEEMAQKLGMSQSQYSRREKGNVEFLAKEIIKIAKILNVPISYLFGEEPAHFTVHHQSGNFGLYNDVKFEQQFYVAEQLIEQYEKRLQEKDKLISLYERMLKEKENT